jgi:hypothetical protein
MISRFPVAFLIACSKKIAGCSGDGVETAPVSGIVKLDGQPVSGAGVVFMPADGPMGSATTDAEGRFKLRTADRDGAVLGEHRVGIDLRKTSGVNIEEGGLQGDVAPGGVKVEWIVPQKYSRPDTSELTALVKDEKNEFTFDLKSK